MSRCTGLDGLVPPSILVTKFVDWKPRPHCYRMEIHMARPVREQCRFIVRPSGLEAAQDSYRRKMGHRQDQTAIRITEIVPEGFKKGAAKTAPAEDKKPTADVKSEKTVKPEDSKTPAAQKSSVKASAAKATAAKETAAQKTAADTKSAPKAKK